MGGLAFLALVSALVAQPLEVTLARDRAYVKVELSARSEGKVRWRTTVPTSTTTVEQSLLRGEELRVAWRRADGTSGTLNFIAPRDAPGWQASLALPSRGPPRLTVHAQDELPLGATVSVVSQDDSTGEGRPLGPLLVLADATFAPRSRFPLRPHEEMEILSIVVDGTLSHHGDQAHGAALGPRSAQLISARSGMVHAEGNDTDSPTRMLQLWFEPDSHGGAPAYFARQLGGAGRQLVAGDEGMPMRADARVWWLSLLPGATEPLVVLPGRRGYLLALAGPLRVGTGTPGAEVTLETGDGAEVEPGELVLATGVAGAALWIDLPSGSSRR